MDGKKVPDDCESPFDFIYINLAVITKPIYKKLGFSPNMITTLSIICSYFMYFYFRNEKYSYSALFLLFSYYFDCLDGNYARTYNMVTVSGDYYDHVSDIITLLLFIYGVYRSNATLNAKKLNYLIVTIFSFLMLIHIGCIYNTYKNKNESPSLSITSRLCPDKSQIKNFRFFGVGTLITVIALLIYNFELIDNIVKKY
jgi:phosphatidylglycerophosphate synthase